MDRWEQIAVHCSLFTFALYDGWAGKTAARDYEEIALCLRCNGHDAECCDRNGRRRDGNMDG
jgi:hypothetical protein